MEQDRLSFKEEFPIIQIYTRTFTSPLQWAYLGLERLRNFPKSNEKYIIDHKFLKLNLDFS